MTNSAHKRKPWLKSFRTFVVHFCHICFVFRGVLGVQLILVLAGGLIVSRCEGLSTWQGIYLALVTSTSVGYGDITPHTVVGQCLSVALALVGAVFLGLVVAAATHAVKVTVREYHGTQGGGPPIDSP